MRHVFIGFCGLNPAMITESLYQLSAEQPEDIPDEIIIITSTEGGRRIEDQLFNAGVWQNFKHSINAGHEKLQFEFDCHYLRLLPEPGQGVDDCKVAADFILDVIRQFTEEPETKITAVIADYRESMSGLGSLTMALLGRRQDELCQLAVDDPFDQQDLISGFFYPDKKDYRLPDGRVVKGSDAVIKLHRIPFTRCRYLFNDRFNQLPGDFMDTVDRVNGKIAENLDAPELIVKPETGQCFVDDIELDFNVREFILYWLIATRCKNCCPPVYGQGNLLDEFRAFAADINSHVMPEIINCTNLESMTVDCMRRLVSNIAGEIKTKVDIAQGRNFCLPGRDRGVYGLMLPSDNIICPRNY